MKAALILLLMAFGDVVHTGRVYLDRPEMVNEELMTLMRVYDKDGEEILNTYVEGAYFKNVFDIKPEGFNLHNLRNGAYVRIVKYSGLQNNKFEVLDNFDDEAMAIALTPSVKRSLDRQGQILLNGLHHNRYSIRNKIKERVLAEGKWDVVYFASQSKDAEARALADLIWKDYILTKPLKERTTKP